MSKWAPPMDAVALSILLVKCLSASSQERWEMRIRCLSFHIEDSSSVRPKEARMIERSADIGGMFVKTM